MSEKTIKQVRGQLRQITKEILPDLLTQELISAVYKQLAAEFGARFQIVEKNVSDTLTEINNRSKDVQDLVVRKSLENMKTLDEAPAEVVPTTS